MAANDFTPTGGSPRAADDADGIKDAVRAALAQHEAAAQEIEETEEVNSGAREETGAPESRTPKPETGKTEAGKSVEGAAQGEKTAAPAAKTEKTEKTEAEPKKPVEEAPKSLEPPSTWSAEQKKAFGELPDKGKAFLLDRHRSMEADYTRKTQEIATQRKEYEALDQLFAPFSDAMKQSGVTRAAAVQGWLAMETTLRSGDFGRQVALIANTAKNYKIDPIKLASQILTVAGVADPKAALEQAAHAAAEANKGKPAPIELPAEVTKKLERVDAIDAHLRNQEQRAIDAEAARIDGEINKFKTATDASGALLHPYFDELMETMSRLIDQATVAKKAVPPIDQLYQEAIFANPAVRQKWLDAREATAKASAEAAQRSAAEKAAAEARAKSEKAKKAGSSVTGSSGLGQPLNGRKGNDSLRATIAAAVEDAEQVVH